MASTIKVTNINTPDGTGNITVDRPLSGSGASLTSLPAGNLTGSLPAISGASLTNLPMATDSETGSRDVSIANSTQSFTAFGKQPDLVDIMFVVGGSTRAVCWAKVNANGTDFGLHKNAGDQWSQTGTTFPIVISSGNSTTVTPSITSTGINLAFAKTGSPTGTVNILITYMKFA